MSYPLHLVTPSDFSSLIETHPTLVIAGLTDTPGSYAITPDAAHDRAAYVYIGETPDMWVLAHLPKALKGTYHIASVFDVDLMTDLCIGWQLGTYSYKVGIEQTYNNDEFATLKIPEGIDQDYIEAVVAATCLARNLINTPPNIMTPPILALAAKHVAAQHGAEFTEITGQDLEDGYPLIHTVGRASEYPPRLVKLAWGEEKNPLVSLVGKGVCFDSGGLDLKPSSSMKLMKKDMGGAAVSLALAQLIMQEELPVRLELYLPIVENAVGSRAMRVSDVYTSRKGLTVEIGNTDAEGRLILADALDEASASNPDLLIDMATLTGAARVALGTDMPAYFSNEDTAARQLDTAAEIAQDPLWQLPLHEPYRKCLKSSVADLSSTGKGGGGAITAALFLEAFVGEDIPWVHLDLMGWNTSGQPGRPEGGEAMGLRAVYRMLEERYGEL